MDGDILISSGQMIRGFVKWEEDFRKNPKEFTDHLTAILSGETPDQYGKKCADYFRSLLIKVR